MNYQLFVSSHRRVLLIFFFFNDTATTEIYTLSLHDALPISTPTSCRHARSRATGRCTRTRDRKSTRLNSSHEWISYAVFCLKKKKIKVEVPFFYRKEICRCCLMIECTCA